MVERASVRVRVRRVHCGLGRGERGEREVGGVFEDGGSGRMMVGGWELGGAARVVKGNREMAMRASRLSGRRIVIEIEAIHKGFSFLKERHLIIRKNGEIASDWPHVF